MSAVRPGTLPRQSSPAKRLLQSAHRQWKRARPTLALGRMSHLYTTRSSVCSRPRALRRCSTRRTAHHSLLRLSSSSESPPLFLTPRLRLWSLSLRQLSRLLRSLTQPTHPTPTCSRRRGTAARKRSEKEMRSGRRRSLAPLMRQQTAVSGSTTPTARTATVTISISISLPAERRTSWTRARGSAAACRCNHRSRRQQRARSRLGMAAALRTLSPPATDAAAAATVAASPSAVHSATADPVAAAPIPAPAPASVSAGAAPVVVLSASSGRAPSDRGRVRRDKEALQRRIHALQVQL